MSRRHTRPPVMDRCGPTGKVRYRSLNAAVVQKGVLRRLGAKTRDPRRQEQRAYRCRHCLGWHLTKQPMYLAPQRPTEETPNHG